MSCRRHRTLNDGLRAMVQDQRTELATVKEDIRQIRDALNRHVAKEDVIDGVLNTAAFSARWVRVAPSAREQVLGANTA